MVSLPRAAYILGRWFDGPHDGYRTRCSGVDGERPAIDGHESVSVAVTCGHETTLSSVMAGLDWVVETASSDATVIVPDHLRGHRAVEDRLDSMRVCGMNVPDALLPEPAPVPRSFPADFFVGFAVCAALLAVYAAARRFFTKRAVKPLVRRHTWSSRDRKDLQTYADPVQEHRRASFNKSREEV
jgi:hypothetical protein